MSDRKRILLVVNPYATAVTHHRRERLLASLQARYAVEAIGTTHQGHATEICRGARGAGYDAVAVLGGDGTINEAANGLAGSAVPLACLPGGSANIFCRLIGTPVDLSAAGERLLALADGWPTRAVDLPAVNGRRFTFASGVGLDASVVARVDAKPTLKRRFGPWFYAVSAADIFLRRYVANPPSLLARTGGEGSGRAASGVTAIVQNAAAYTYFGRRPIAIAPPTSLRSGTLSAAVLHRAFPIDLPFIAARALSTRLAVEGHRQITAWAGIDSLVILSTDGRPLPVEVDGDYIGTVTEARYSVPPEQLRLLGP